MPNWKKVIVSGSSPHFNHITASGVISASGYISASEFLGPGQVIVSGSSTVGGSIDTTASFKTLSFTGNAVSLVTSAPNTNKLVTVQINTGSAAADPFPFTGDAQITGSFLVAGANSGTAPTTSSFKIDSLGNFYHLGRHTGNNTAFANNRTNVVIGNDITNDGDFNSVVIGYGGDIASHQAVVGIGALVNVDAITATAIGAAARANTQKAISIGYYAGNSATSKGINIGKYARGQGEQNIVLSSTGLSTVTPTKANTFGIYMTDASPNFEIEATGSSTLSGSSFTIEKSGSTAFEVIGSQGTLFSVDDDLDGTIFTANDKTGLPVLEASASGEVYIGKAPQSLYTTAVISSTTAATTQSIFGLSTSSYGGAFFDYTVQSGSDARAGSIMSVWNGSNISFTETTTTDIGNTTDFNVIVHISQSQAQIASHASRAGYNVKTIIRSI